jgi:hypothetical protein
MSTNDPDALVCHWICDPVCPVNFIVVVVPLQTLDGVAFAVPPFKAGVMEMVTMFEVAVLQLPFFTLALKRVTAVSVVE